MVELTKEDFINIFKAKIENPAMTKYASYPAGFMSGAEVDEWMEEPVDKDQS